jgi:hypothetical protein
MQREVDNYLVKKLGLSGIALKASVEAVRE